jgi:hypothetical protein
VKRAMASWQLVSTILVTSNVDRIIPLSTTSHYLSRCRDTAVIMAPPRMASSSSMASFESICVFVGLFEESRNYEHGGLKLYQVAHVSPSSLN